jgi:serine/threonine-protein kinase RsbW
VQIKSTMGSEKSPHAFRGSARESSSTQGHRGRRRGGLAESRANGLRSDVRLTLPSRPENVAVIRHMLGAFAEALRLPPDTVEDMRLAVTEACTNVVRHAYDEGELGTIDVVIRPTGESLELIVSDHGSGMRPSSDMNDPGLGLPMIAALADEVEIGPGPQRGSRLAMSFRCRPRLGVA